MSQIDELVTELAPQGITHLALGEIAGYSDTRVDADKLENTNFVGVDNLLPNKGGKTVASYLPNTARLTAYEAGDVLLGNIRPYLKKVWLANNVGGCSGDVLAIRISAAYRDAINPAFLYYLLSSDGFFAYNMQHAKGAKMPRGNKEAILAYRIPVPPLEVQREIVRILDQFTQLEAELEAELEARRSQYEHYRNQLLFSDDGIVRWARLGDVADFRRGTAITAKTTVPGDVRVIANGPESTYSHAVSNRDGETLVVARSGAYAGLVSFWRGPIFLTDAFSVHPKAKALSPRFAFYLLQTRQTELHALKAGAGVPHVRVKDVEAYEVPIPNLREQDRIVQILDKFDALVNDLSVGLPAELAARRKQYEYYRDRLLKFEEATA